MILDNLGLLRGDGSSPTITTTEAGYTSTTRHGTTGRAVVPVYKTGYAGIPVCVLYNMTDGGDHTRAFRVTVEACDLENFASGEEVAATFPIVTVAAGKVFHVRRVHTQKKYLRSVITCTTAGDAGTLDALIFITHGLMNKG